MKENNKLKKLLFLITIIAFVSIVIVSINITNSRKSLSKLMDNGNAESLYFYRGNWDNSYYNDANMSNYENWNVTCPYDGNRDNCENWNVTCPYDENRDNCENWNTEGSNVGNGNNCRNGEASYGHHRYRNAYPSSNKSCNNYNF